MKKTKTLTATRLKKRKKVNPRRKKVRKVGRPEKVKFPIQMKVVIN